MRDTFHQDLAQLGIGLVEMSRLVAAAISRATQALLDADVALAEGVISDDEPIDLARHHLEENAFEILARQQPVASDLRTVVTTLRMVADLERMGDLARHIAQVTRMRYPTEAVPPELKETMRQMGAVAEQIVTKAGDVIATRDTARAAELEADDDVMDDLHRTLLRTMLSDDWSYGVEPAVDLALLGRYYERFADHAVSVARRVVYLVTGEMPQPVP